MDLTFKELRCPTCGGELKPGETHLGTDVRMVKKCTTDDCKFWMIIIIPNDNYEYNVSAKLKQENPGQSQG